jgi:hypothetical protein
MTDTARHAAPVDTDQDYPIRVEGRAEGTPGRGRWLVKWLLLLPHFLLLAALWTAAVTLTVLAGFAVLFTGRYPAGIFDFVVGVLRWHWRVGFYGYEALATDRYPPFTLSDVPAHPARLDVDRPAKRSRGRVLVQSWLLAIPHYLLLAVFLGGGIGARAGLLGLLVLFAALVLLFRGRYPAGILDLVLGIDRWVMRVVGYVLLLTDRYPPLRLDQGPIDPAGPLPPQPLGELPASRTVTGVAGGLLLLTATALLVSGLRTARPELWISGAATVLAGLVTALFAARRVRRSEQES